MRLREVCVVAVAVRRDVRKQASARAQKGAREGIQAAIQAGCCGAAKCIEMKERMTNGM